MRSIECQGLNATHQKTGIADGKKIVTYIGDAHKTYESGSGMAATTHGDRILEAAEDWIYVWYEEYTKDLLDDPDLLSEEFGEAGLTMPWDWFNQLNGTLGELRSRCEQFEQ
jgi:hypothetical protein